MNMQAGVGLSVNKDYLLAVNEAVGQAKAKIEHTSANVALVFTSQEFSHPRVLKTINSLLGPIPTLGCSSPAILTNQGVFKYGLAIMLLSLPEDMPFSAALINGIKTKPPSDIAKELGKKLLADFKEEPYALGMLFSDGSTKGISDLTHTLQEKILPASSIIGSCLTDSPNAQKASLYFKDEVLNDSACGILLSEKLKFGLGIKHGWRPLGKTRYATKCHDNILEEIDGVPAAELYQEYLGKDADGLKAELKHVSALYPLGMYLPGMEEPLLRSVISVEDGGALALRGGIIQNSPIRLMVAAKESCLAATALAAEEAKANLKGVRANFVLVFNSISRYILLGRQAGQEIKIIQGKFGENTPIIGVYTRGEEVSLKPNNPNKLSFHNHVAAILAIGA